MKYSIFFSFAIDFLQIDDYNKQELNVSDASIL